MLRLEDETNGADGGYGMKTIAGYVGGDCGDRAADRPIAAC